NKLEEIEHLEKVYVVTNNKFYNDFFEWKNLLATRLDVILLNDGSNTESDRLGAVKDILFCIDKENVSDDLLVVGGDNLFDFDLTKFVSSSRDKNIPLVGLYNLEDKNLAKQYGTVKLDKDSKVIIEFIEKSKNPETSVISTCVYFFPKDSLKFLEDYVNNGSNSDTPGSYIKWLVDKIPVYGHVFKKKLV
ncbi:nucleotidyltransferase family protein, partial [bacterium]|nr:nucleotidyltransferase family protein [bacterium]